MEFFCAKPKKTTEILAMPEIHKINGEWKRSRSIWGSNLSLTHSLAPLPAAQRNILTFHTHTHTHSARWKMMAGRYRINDYLASECQLIN